MMEKTVLISIACVLVSLSYSVNIFLPLDIPTILPSVDTPLPLPYLTPLSPHTLTILITTTI